MAEPTCTLSLLPVASFAIASAGLGVRFLLPTGPAKQTLIAAAFIFLLLTSSLLWQQQRLERQWVRSTAEEILTSIGNDKKTYEEILAGLRRPSYQLADRAIDLLLDERRIGSAGTIVIDKSSDKPFNVRLYFVRTF